MKLVYVAGPYRAPTEFGVLENIRNAEALALRVWKAGAACICPHKNTAFFGGAADDSVWLAGDIEMMIRCDAVIVTDGWHRSSGTRDEIRIAKERGIPVFYGSEWPSFIRWLTPESAPNQGDQRCN